MENNLQEIELFCVIVNFGSGRKVVKIAKKNGISGGTVFLGKGTVNNRILKWLDLDDIFHGNRTRKRSSIDSVRAKLNCDNYRFH